MSSSQHVGGKIFIDDLRAPLLSPLQEQALGYARRNPATLSVERVLEAARAQTGLSNFGSDDFQGRMKLWIAAATDPAVGLTDLARAGVYADMVRYASNRLRVEDVVSRHPEILDIVIDRPVIVAGLPRSGTTYLQNFLGADRQLRSLPYWEALYPVPASASETGDPAVDPRYARAKEAWRQMDAMLPYVKAIHPFDPDHISEDVELQAIDFGSYAIEWTAPSYTWRDYYLATDQTESYRYLKKVLQVMTWFRGPNRWLMKCPQHMEQLSVVHRVFPDATIVINHRDPVASIQSAITSLAYSGRIRLQRIDTDAIVDYWISRYETLLRRCVRDRDGLPAAQVEDVYFHDLIDHPMTIVERIYAKAALPLGADLRRDMHVFLDANKRGKHGAIDHDLRRDFGLDPLEIRARFQFYFDRFPVRPEVA